MNKPLASLTAVLTSLLVASCDGNSSNTPQLGSGNQPVNSTLGSIPVSPNEDDRYSQITGVQSDQSHSFVDRISETISEDARYVVTFTVRQSTYLNIQIENTGNTTAEIFTLDEENYNRYLNRQSSEKIADLSFTPLASSFSSQWTLLSPGRYNTIVDNTDRGSVSPPWNGVNDRVRFTLSMLASPQYTNGLTPLLSDFNDTPDASPVQLDEVSTVQVFESEGF